jgi:hypothetical protein
MVYDDRNPMLSIVYDWCKRAPSTTILFHRNSLMHDRVRLVLIDLGMMREGKRRKVSVCTKGFIPKRDKIPFIYK